MAGKYQKLLNWLKDAAKYGVAGTTDLKNKGEFLNATAVRLGMDAVGGTMVGITHPGDLGDKVIAGTAEALGGALGGIATAGALRGITKGSHAGSNRY